MCERGRRDVEGAALQELSLLSNTNTSGYIFVRHVHDERWLVIEAQLLVTGS